MPFIRPLLWSVSLCAIASPTIAQSPEATATNNYRVSGVVVDRGGNPMMNAEVTLLTGNVIRTVMPSGEDGRFNLGSHPAGKATLQVRRLGYEQRNVNLKIGDESKATFAEIILVELPQKLEEILVKSDEQGRLREFAAHRA